jgi:hypothetical protein
MSLAILDQQPAAHNNNEDENEPLVAQEERANAVPDHPEQQNLWASRG